VYASDNPKNKKITINIIQIKNITIMTVIAKKEKTLCHSQPRHSTNN
jgi:hypothetical protein